ncbi:hypothetical protein N7U66_11435 [Lacinutrix neustonica]|uniref:Uncharacterized protein n=1 Tax=Lacinutrix neustonica TaxID=2980107 RepID=A0A9E8SCM4_9FLAO|nr:hypothetical protein [Lacinutrix neustonica]WAC00857.1 hypothetical protein N7U66_11435 [Lacinutrix neustonica]
MNKIVYKRKVPKMKMAFGIIFFIFGFSLLFHFYGFLICGMSTFFFYTDGSEIDLDSKTYRTFISLFGFRFGQWKALPDIEYISVFSTSEINTIRSLGAEANIKSDVIQLNLFHNRNQKITAYTTTDKKDAFKMADEIAQILNIDILDATEPESKWL